MSHFDRNSGSMEKANQILGAFLRDRRVQSGLSLDSVSKLLGQPKESITLWEDEPLRVPLNQFSKMISVYKFTQAEFQEMICEVECVFRKH